MKKTAIIKLIVSSIFAVVLIFVLWFSIQGSTQSSLASSYGSYRFANADLYEILNQNEEMIINQKEISKIQIYWVGGNVNVLNSSTENISFKEEIKTDEVEEKNLLRYYISKKVLTIRFCAPTWNIKKNIRESKDLTIYIPNYKFSSVFIETVSANISYDG